MTCFYSFNRHGLSWPYENCAGREERRAQMAADPGWQAYALKVRPYLMHQETRIMKPAPFFEETMRKMLAAAKG
jgi:hypothetical protein